MPSVENKLVTWLRHAFPGRALTSGGSSDSSAGFLVQSALRSLDQLDRIRAQAYAEAVASPPQLPVPGEVSMPTALELLPLQLWSESPASRQWSTAATALANALQGLTQQLRLSLGTSAEPQITMLSHAAISEYGIARDGTSTRAATAAGSGRTAGAPSTEAEAAPIQTSRRIAELVLGGDAVSPPLDCTDVPTQADKNKVAKLLLLLRDEQQQIPAPAPPKQQPANWRRLSLPESQREIPPFPQAVGVDLFARLLRSSAYLPRPARVAFISLMAVLLEVPGVPRPRPFSSHPGSTTDRSTVESPGSTPQEPRLSAQRAIDDFDVSTVLLSDRLLVQWLFSRTELLDFMFAAFVDRRYVATVCLMFLLLVRVHERDKQRATVDRGLNLILNYAIQEAHVPYLLVQVAREPVLERRSAALQTLSGLLHGVASGCDFLLKNEAAFLIYFERQLIFLSSVDTSGHLAPVDSVLQRTAIKFLFDLLVERRFVRVLQLFVTNTERLQRINQVILTSENCTAFEAFHLLKLFVMNPRRPPAITHVLATVREDLLLRLQTLVRHMPADDEFRGDRDLVVQALRGIRPKPAI